MAVNRGGRQFDVSAAEEQHRDERAVRVKAVRPPRNDPQLVVDALDRPVRHPGVQVGQDAGGVLADRPRQAALRRRPAPRRPPTRRRARAPRGPAAPASSCHSGRPHQAEQRRRGVRFRQAHGEGVDEALLHRTVSGMPRVQHHPGARQIEVRGGALRPGQARQAPQILAPSRMLGIVAVSVGAIRWFYAERLGIMEQRVRLAEQTARAASSGSTSAGPLPRYSLGGAPGGTTGLQFDDASTWSPAADHRDVPVDWAELDDVQVAAELHVWVRDLDGAGREGWGQVRVKNVTDDVVVAEGDRLPAARGVLQRFAIPRSIRAEGLSRRGSGSEPLDRHPWRRRVDPGTIVSLPRARGRETRLCWGR